LVPYCKGRTKIPRFWIGYRKIFGPKWDEVTQHSRVIHNEEYCDLFRSASIVPTGVAQSVK
jgi:hypothetical protein